MRRDHRIITRQIEFLVCEQRADDAEIEIFFARFRVLRIKFDRQAIRQS